MKANVKIVGLGRRMAGVSSKNGRNYDFIPVAFCMPDQYFDGYRAATSNIDGPMVDAIGGLHVGNEVEIVYHFANNAIYVDDIRSI